MQEWEMKPEEIHEKIKKMTWSFSRVNSISSCLYSFVLHYVFGYEDAHNCWDQFGTLCHKVIEMILKGELDIFDAPQYYIDHYAEYVTCSFPSNKYVDLGEKTYQQGLDYFNNLSFDFDRYEVLGIEQELSFKVGTHPFQGYADAIYRDKETGEIILRDHKTASFKYLKDGSISKTNAKHFDEFKKQEYLYCIPLIEKYGKVDKLTWNMIKDQKIIEIPFNEAEYREAQEWAINNIHKLEEETLWLPDTSETYYCTNICGQRHDCFYHQ